MTSIRQFPATHPLPDWRNLGVMLRVLLGINLLAALAALVQAPSLTAWPASYLDVAAFVEPVLLIVLACLSLARDLLWRQTLRRGQGLVLGMIAVLAGVLASYGETLGLLSPAATGRIVVLALAAGGLLLLYFELRARALTPAQAEARLAALNARIRPHFLFNTLNAVLSLIRRRPQQAEQALESLSDLFRAAMRDPGERVSLGDEIELGEQYLALEQLRLGERLQIDWQVDPTLLGQPILPLMLQPLLENAVYHGIEPSPGGGTVRISIQREAEQMRIEIANPLPGKALAPPGNQMALANIRERLALYYDLEARLEIQEAADCYSVLIALPCPNPA